MSKVGDIERRTQDRVVRFFCQEMHYDYLGNWEERGNNRNIENEYLRPFLQRQGCRPDLIDRALYEFHRVAGDQNRSLYDVNKDVYTLLRYGVKVKAEAGEKYRNGLAGRLGEPRK